MSGSHSCLQTCMSDLVTKFAVRFRGTPMGTNCASHLTNYYLTMYKLSFVMRLAALYVDVAFAFLRTVLYQIACAFLLTARYIDDLASISNPYLHHLLYVDQHFQHARITGIYPRTLLVTSVDSSDSINYMDVSIQREAGSVSRLSKGCSLSNTPMPAPTSAQQPNMPSLPVSTTDCVESSWIVMTSPSGWLASSTTCTPKDMM